MTSSTNAYSTAVQQKQGKQEALTPVKDTVGNYRIVPNGSDSNQMEAGVTAIPSCKVSDSDNHHKTG